MSTEDTEVQVYLRKIIERVNGLQTILVTDRDGVTLINANQSFIEDPSDSSLAATFSVCSEQASKLKMGKNKSITTFFDNKIFIHVNHLPLVISFIADKNVNVGVIQAFVGDVKRALDPLKSSIQESEHDAV